MSAPALPPELAAAVWRGSDFGHAPTRVVGSGWEALDRELPGGGWPCGALTEVLSPRPALLFALRPLEARAETSPTPV